MIKAIGLVCAGALALGCASSFAATSASDAPKSPSPDSLQFVDGYGDTLAAGSAAVMGRLYFHRDHDTILVEYQPATRPNPTATRIVMLCTDTGAQVSFPISEQYLGPVPACGSFANLKFRGE